MSGTTGDIIPIVIVPIVALVFWLSMIYHVNSHPRRGGQAPADTGPAHVLQGSGPAQRLSQPRPGRSRPTPGPRRGGSRPRAGGGQRHPKKMTGAPSRWLGWP